MILASCVSLAVWTPFPETVADEDVAGLQEQTEYLFTHPLDLNKAGREELGSIPWLNPLLADRIVRFRDSAGAFLDVAQLGLVPGVSPELLRVVVPMLVVSRAKPAGLNGSLLMRVGTDSVAGGAGRSGWFGRAQVVRGSWLGVALAEKDRGEPASIDWLGLGLQYWDGVFGAVIGNYTCGVGLGIVHSGPHRSPVEQAGSRATGPTGLRTLRSAAETRALRGLGFELRRKGWHASVFGSQRMLDARLNPDGTVARLRLDGLHDDSAARAERDLVAELAAGVMLGKRLGQASVSGQLGLAAFDREFAPADSSNSFHGRQVVTGGVSGNLVTGGYRLGTELAGSSGGGIAGGLELDGSWQGLSAGLAVTGYSARFSAPHGRWRTLTNRRDRLNARVGLGYDSGGFSASLSGRTYRDYDEDSLPANVELRLVQVVEWFRAELRLGWQFRQVNQRQRNAHVELTCRSSSVDAVSLVVEDRYPEDRSGRGVLLGMAGYRRAGPVRLAAAVARVMTSGKGARMYWSEPGVMRIGQHYTTSRPGWRLGTSAAVLFGGGVEIAAKLGTTIEDAVTFDCAGQLRLGLN